MISLVSRVTLCILMVVLVAEDVCSFLNNQHPPQSILFQPTMTRTLTYSPLSSISLKYSFPSKTTPPRLNWLGGFNIFASATHTGSIIGSSGMKLGATTFTTNEVNEKCANAGTVCDSLSKAAAVFVPDDIKWPLYSVPIPKHYENYLDYVMIPHGMILDRIEQLAHQLAVDYDGKEVHFLCVLKGAALFFQDLLTAYMKEQERRLLPCKYDFIRVKSYEGMHSSGEVKITGLSDDEIAALAGKNVIFVEDIIDTGLTMKRLMNFMKEKVNPASVRVVSLIEKRLEKPSLFKADYVGFSLPNKFIVGYGMDYNEYLRDIRHITVLNEKGIDAFRVK